jgi:GMP synthase-like glutamine amidotransferase
MFETTLGGRAIMEKNILIIKQVEQEGPGLIEKIFAENGWGLKTVELSHGEKLPSDFDETGALVVLGGPMNVYEEKQYPFLKEEESLIRKALIEEVPILGICLGAQLLAKTCGARIKKAPQKEIGWYKVEKTGDGKKDALFKESPDHVQVFQWHEDTFDIPEGAVLLAEGKDCKNQAFRVGLNAYGLQFHIEVTEDMVQSWLQSGEEAVVEKILKDTKKVKESYHTEAKRILLNFMRIAESFLRLRRVIKLFVEEGKETKKRQPALWWNSKERELTTTKNE